MDLLIARHVEGLKIDEILLPPPDRDSLDGDYPVGEVIYPEKPFANFGVREQEWIRHCASSVRREAERPPLP